MFAECVDFIDAIPSKCNCMRTTVISFVQLDHESQHKSRHASLALALTPQSTTSMPVDSANCLSALHLSFTLPSPMSEFLCIPCGGIPDRLPCSPCPPSHFHYASVHETPYEKEKSDQKPNPLSPFALRRCRQVVPLLFPPCLLVCVTPKK